MEVKTSSTHVVLNVRSSTTIADVDSRHLPNRDLSCHYLRSALLQHQTRPPNRARRLQHYLKLSGHMLASTQLNVISGLQLGISVISGVLLSYAIVRPQDIRLSTTYTISVAFFIVSLDFLVAWSTVVAWTCLREQK